MINVIGFTGKMGVGKSTAVNYLKGSNQGDFKVIRFAGVLYEMQKMLYDRIASVYPTPEPLKDRKLLQWLGTEWGRGLSNSLWIDLWRKEASKAVGNDFIVLAEDVRFDNEAEAVRGLGGAVIEITASTIDDRDVVTNGIVGHASEKGISRGLIDVSISNDGSMHELEQKLRDTLHKLQGNV